MYRWSVASVSNVYMVAPKTERETRPTERWAQKLREKKIKWNIYNINYIEGSRQMENSSPQLEYYAIICFFQRLIIHPHTITRAAGLFHTYAFISSQQQQLFSSHSCIYFVVCFFSTMAHREIQKLYLFFSLTTSSHYFYIRSCYLPWLWIFLLFCFLFLFYIFFFLSVVCRLFIWLIGFRVSFCISFFFDCLFDFRSFFLL